ncbi:putative MFS family arabinose efflux permease [Amycolatopsis echigonensis]|uniref:MFS family arabinose efflux permease n=1 Tax=Amycolatopsis echigonensis TaxID=2576905 RepID=A0A2N3WA99_9PSEU|nr:MFS transporter [Amycolatopsis niigatensis]PKV90800.1 putative MFS family arabinose efflux permease [Amycolatopsis niigatensis]
MNDSRRWAALAVLLVAEAMNLLDTTIVQVAAPAVHAELGGAASTISFYTAGYTLPFALLLITGGRLGDIIGRRRTFQVGVAGFVLTSGLCAAAATPGFLLVFRALQGASAALVIPQTIGLIRVLFDGAARARALGMIGPVMGLAAVTGPVLGGLLTDAWSWRSVFLVNVPLGLAVLAASGLLAEDRSASRPRLDLLGTGLVVLGAGLVVCPLLTQWNGYLVAAGVAVLVVFALQQRFRGGLIERSLFGGLGFPAGLATSVLFFAVMTGLTQVVVLFLQLTQQADARTAGLSLLPWSCGLAVSSFAAGRWLVPRFGTRILFAGVAFLAVGIAGLALGWPVLVALAVAGTGTGLFTVPFFTAALALVRPSETGSAAGLLNAVQQLGGTIGVAVLTTAFLATDVTIACWTAVALTLAAGLTAIGLIRGTRAGSPSEPSRAGV